MKNLIVVRNYINEDLLEITATNYKELRIPGVDFMYGKRLLEKCFFDDKIQKQYDYVVFVDEDCIISNIDEIIKMMGTTDIDIVGVPDGNCIDIRQHRPDVPNLFFVVIKTDKIKNIQKEKYIGFKVNDLYCGNTFAFDSFEPYYGFFCYIIYELHCNFFHLNAKTSELDNITTEVFFDGNIIAAHTWFARKYKDNEENRKRIVNAISYYKNNLKQC